MPNIGDPLVFSVAFYTSAGAFANPTIGAAAIYDPSMTLIAVSPTFVHQAGGFFTYTLAGTNVTVAGTYTAIVSTADATVTPAEAIGTVDVSAAATPADVHTQVENILTVETFAEPSAVPAATSSILDKLNWLFTLARNKRTQTTSTQTVLADDNTTPIAASAVTKSGTEVDVGKWS